MQKMNKCKESSQKFIVGEAYLFRSDNDSTIIGIFEKYQNGSVILESATYTNDFRKFFLNKTLPSNYRLWRRAFRKELRDYMYNLAVYEMTEKQNKPFEEL